uniref:Uncharacterized protein n=1 Tax=Rhizophora mucronata TaxID=61149 RepID=A0A2P2PLV0_RHIMU
MTIVYIHFVLLFQQHFVALMDNFLFILSVVLHTPQIICNYANLAMENKKKIDENPIK